VDSVEREERIRALLPLVKRIARRISKMVRCDYDDLVGDGCVGLIRAVDNYDPSRGPIDTYARQAISGAMLNGIRRMDWVTERMRRAMRDGEIERYQLAVARGSVPTLLEMEERRPGFNRAIAAVAHSVPLSLDRKLPERENLACDWSNDPGHVIGERSERAWIGAAIDALPWRERSVVRGYYYDDCSLREVGRRMKISAQRASQLHKVAMRRLRKSLDAAAR
jgi:RNA polymerase sigma factor FliA